jgi:hypothetical protein
MKLNTDSHPIKVNNMINSLYLYLPSSKKKTVKEQIEIIKSYFLNDEKIKIEYQYDDENYKDGYGKKKMTYLSISNGIDTSNFLLMLDMDFGSDNRSFVRIRTSPKSNFFTDKLKEIALMDDGYYGNSSKEFLRPKTKEKVYCVKDGITRIEFSIGEVISKIDESKNGYMYNLERPLNRNKILEDYSNYCDDRVFIEDGNIYLKIA